MKKRIEGNIRYTNPQRFELRDKTPKSALNFLSKD